MHTKRELICNKILMVLWEWNQTTDARDGLMCSELCQRTKFTPGNVNNALKELMNPGWPEKKRAARSGEPTDSSDETLVPAEALIEQLTFRHPKYLDQTSKKSPIGRRGWAYGLNSKVVVTCPATAYLVVKLLEVKGNLLPREELIKDFMRHCFKNKTPSEPSYTDDTINERIDLACKGKHYMDEVELKEGGELRIRAGIRAQSQSGYLIFLKKKLGDSSAASAS